MARTVWAQCAAPPSGRSSRVTEVTTTYLSFISATLSATRRGSSGVGGKGVSCFRCTEAAASGADVSQDHEGCGSAAPAFGLVRTHAAAANRMQRMFVDYLLYLAYSGVRWSRIFNHPGFFSTSTCHKTSAFKFIIFQLMQKYEKSGLNNHLSALFLFMKFGCGYITVGFMPCMFVQKPAVTGVYYDNAAMPVPIRFALFILFYIHFQYLPGRIIEGVLLVFP